MTGLLAGRRIAVTGALGGIGAAITRRLVDDGARVLGVDLPELVERAPQAGAGFPAVGIDLRGSDAGARLLRACEAELGGIDGLINNAGVELRAPLQQHDDTAWDRVMGINVGVPFRLSRDVSRHMAGEQGAAIVNICSIAVTGFAGQVAYDASKGALQTLSRSLAVELGPQGIRVNAVCPGFIDTPMLDEGSLRSIAEKVARTLPLGRIGQPEDVAHAVSWLSSDRAAYVTGQSIFIDGGMIRS